MPAQAASNARLWTQFTTANGLPQNSITALAQTRDGAIWIGTAAGLARFDGADFKIFDVASTPALAGNRILSLMVSSDGALWIGTRYSGVMRYADCVFASFEGQPQAPRGSVHAIVQDGSGTMPASNVCASRGPYSVTPPRF